MKKIYIAGNIVGENTNACFSKFETAEKIIRDKGYKVVNSFKLYDNTISHIRAIKICLLELKLCDAIFMLPCCTKSKQAEKELEAAFDHNLDIYTEFTEL